LQKNSALATRPIHCGARKRGGGTRGGAQESDCLAVVQAARSHPMRQPGQARALIARHTARTRQVASPSSHTQAASTGATCGSTTAHPPWWRSPAGRAPPVRPRTPRGWRAAAAAAARRRAAGGPRRRSCAPAAGRGSVQPGSRGHCG
jgi:hypothetical protein